MFTRATVAITCLGWFVIASHAEEPPKYKPIDPETIAAYEKLGAEYGGFEINVYGYVVFFSGKEGAAKRLPGFRFKKLPDGKLPKLPPVQALFGLDLSLQDDQPVPTGRVRNRRSANPPTVTDAALKELKDLKNLAALDLGITEVTDAGLNELKDLKNLTSLCLMLTTVSDVGLNELKDLKNLTTLNLEVTKVTDAGLNELREVLPKCKITR